MGTYYHPTEKWLNLEIPEQKAKWDLFITENLKRNPLDEKGKIMFCQFQAWYADDCEDDNLENAWNFYHQTILSGAESTHCGDCTNMPATCGRCVFEDRKENAEKILAFLASKPL